MIEINNATDGLVLAAPRFLNQKVASPQLSINPLFCLDRTQCWWLRDYQEASSVKVCDSNTNDVVSSIWVFAPYSIEYSSSRPLQAVYFPVSRRFTDPPKLAPLIILTPRLSHSVTSRRSRKISSSAR